MVRAAAAGRAADPLGYASCIAVAFAAEQADTGLLACCGQLASRQVLAEAVLEPFLRYAEASRARAEDDPVRSLFAKRPLLERDERRIVLGLVADHLPAVEGCHRNASECYAGAPG